MDDGLCCVVIGVSVVLFVGFGCVVCCGGCGVGVSGGMCILC